MAADPKDAPGAVRQAVTGLRGWVAAVERALALGILTVVVWSLVQFGVAVRILPLLLGSRGVGGGVGDQILTALASQASLLVVLPGLAWILGLVLEGSPLALGVGAAAVVEAFVVGVQYLSGGGMGLVGRPVYLATLLAVGLAAGLLGGLAFRHGRRFIDARERGRRRIAPPAKPPREDAPAGDGSGSGSSP